MPTAGTTKAVPTRADLVDLCEAGVVPVDQWSNRDTSDAQIQLGKALALLRAGCDYTIANDPLSDGRTWWVEITYPGFAHFDWDGGTETELFYIPTRKRLDQAAGRDWY